jgi:hypothetical protein
MLSRLIVLLVSLLLVTPAVIFWLWLVSLPARVAKLCPEECECDTGGFSVFCSSTSLKPVPLILTDVRLLELFDYNTSLFERDAFFSRGMTNLEILDVRFCGLRKVEFGAFNGLTNLKELTIWGNKISEIIPGTFENMISLDHLNLMYNRIEYLNSDVFSGLVNLKYIDLRGNQLQCLPPDMFLGLPNLERLILNSNPTLQVPTDRNFINSLTLSHLDISRCNVSSVSVETFANVSALERLDLSDSRLRTLDINVLRALPKLSALYLDGNPLQCDCQLQEVWRWCEDRNIWTAAGYITPECDTPSEVKGMWWGVLEKGQCLEGNIQYHEDFNSTSYSYIETDKKYKYDVGFIKKYQVPLYAVPFIFGTISNAILLIIIIRNKDMQTLPNMYIINLAISDIIYLTVLFFDAFMNRISDTSLYSDNMCTFLPFCHRMSVGLSAYSVAVYSVQRYRVTVDPFQVRVPLRKTRRVIVATICGVWIVAALFAVPSALSKYLCVKFLLLRSTNYYHFVVIFELIVSCVLPLCVVAFSYVMTARHLVKSSLPISEGTQNPQLKRRRIIAKTVVGLAVVFIISYVPYHTFWAYFIYSEKENDFSNFTDYLDYATYKVQYSYLISTIFLSVNSCLNPVALFFTSSSFREHLKRYLTCFCKTNSPPNDIVLTRRK